MPADLFCGASNGYLASFAFDDFNIAGSPKTEFNFNDAKVVQSNFTQKSFDLFGKLH